MGIKQVVTAPRSPWQNAYVERLIGSIRRECLDHIIIFNEHHLRRVLSSYFQYHHQTEPISHSARTAPRRAQYTRQPPATSLSSRRLAVCTIAMN
jgi:transposase InsO family protein